jgi:anti-sigma factor RsiW
MDCQQVKVMLGALVDGRVLDSERHEIMTHVDACGDCGLQLAQLHAVRDSLRNLAAKPVPPHLALSLRVVASREAHRRRRYAGLQGWLRSVGEEFQLFANNLMRPLALPAAGGLFSAVVLFSAIMTNYSGIVRQPADDVPTVLATSATMKSGLFSAEEIPSEVLVLDVLVDEQGRAIDYSLAPGTEADYSPEFRRQLVNTLLFTRFEPATAFGQPTATWVKVSYRRIDVKG